MKIWIIYHNTLENTNIFVTNPDDIDNVIENLCNDTKTDISEWKIRVLEEGVKFCADMTSF